MYDIVCEVLFKEVKFVFGRIGTVYPDVASPEGNKAWGQPESYITPDTLQKLYRRCIFLKRGSNFSSNS